MVCLGSVGRIHHQVKISSDRGVLGEVFKVEGFTRVRLRQAGTWAGGQEEDWALSQTGAVRGATAVRYVHCAWAEPQHQLDRRACSLVFSLL